MGSQLLVDTVVPKLENESCTLKFSNFSNNQSWSAIQQILQSYGKVRNCDRARSNERDGSYSVIVTYETPEQAQQALVGIDSLEMENGVIIKGEYIADPVRHPDVARGYQSNFIDFPLRIVVPSEMVGAIIGRGGATIRKITSESRARVDIHRKESAGQAEKVITIYGNTENRSVACQKILDIMEQEYKKTGPGDVCLKVLGHNNFIGRLIGKNGVTIKRIMEQTDSKISISSYNQGAYEFNVERAITIKGTLENIGKAERLVSAKMRQSYENDLTNIQPPRTFYFPNSWSPMMPPMDPQPPYINPRGMGMPMRSFMRSGPMYPTYPMVYPVDVPKETVCVFIPNVSVGAIIGTGGSVIREMINISGATIKVNTSSVDEDIDKAIRRVTITGPPEAQWKAQYMIFKKMHFDNPGWQDVHVKVEVYIPTDLVGRVIGKGGTTIRDIQHSTHATVKFPDGGKNSVNSKTRVHVIGDFFSNLAAQRRIQMIVYQQAGSGNLRRASIPASLPADVN